MFDATEIGDRRNEVFADTFNGPRAGFANLAALYVLGEDRSNRIGQHELHRGIDPAEVSCQPGDCSGGANTDDDRVKAMFALLPDLGPGGLLVRVRVVRVAELIGEKRAGNFRRESSGGVLVVLGMAFADIRSRQIHFGAERFQMQHLFARHLVGHDEHDSIALCARDQRKTQAGVAGGRFDHGAARLQLAAPLGAFDHRAADPVLDRAAGVLRFELQEQRARPGIEPRHLNHRRVADQVEHRGRRIG